MSSATIKPAFSVYSWLRALWSLLRNRPTAYRLAFQNHPEIAIETPEEWTNFFSCAFYDGVTVGPPSAETLRLSAKLQQLKKEMIQ